MSEISDEFTIEAVNLLNEYGTNLQFKSNQTCIDLESGARGTASVDYELMCFVEKYKEMELSETILRSDIKLICTADFDMETGDTVNINSQKCDIVSVSPVMIHSDIIIYEAQARA